MAGKTQVVEITTEYLVEWDGEEYYHAHPTTKHGEIDPAVRAIELAIDMDYWEEDCDD